MMTVAVCDDNENHNEKLMCMLRDYSTRSVIGTIDIFDYLSGLELLERYHHGVFDMIFLDVEMPFLNGFDTARAIREIDLDVDIIFITHMESFVLKGYDYNAKGYLGKNIAQVEIDKLMDRLINERVRSAGMFHNVKIKKGGDMLLHLSKVLYFESGGHDISAVLEKDVYTFNDTITNLAETLENVGFIRISQSHLVNMAHVFGTLGSKVIIKKGKDLNIGRKYRKNLDEAIKKMVINKWK